MYPKRTSAREGSLIRSCRTIRDGKQPDNAVNFTRGEGYESRENRFRARSLLAKEGMDVVSMRLQATCNAPA